MSAKPFAEPLTRYTKFVSLGKNVLWLLIAIIIGTIIWIASSDRGEQGSRLVFTNDQQAIEVENKMIKPHYQGLDERNNPYTVFADSALQKDENTVILKTVSADMQQEDGTWLALKSGSGELKIEEEKVFLTDHVNMFYEGGYEFESDYAHVDIGKGTAYGDSPIQGQGPIGTLKANRFEVEDRGKIIRFNGSVRLKLYRE